jgi:ketosteroid isomerase-like protein
VKDYATNSTAVEAIRTVEERFEGANARMDFKALSRIFSDDFRYTSGGGETRSSTEWRDHYLARRQSEPPRV